jgi:2,4-dienoyl-CoA reductase-like NADH-dependent reductase (Old Yellow Enzyme family)
MNFPRIARLLDPDAFAARLAELNLEIPFDRAVTAGADGPLEQPLLLVDASAGTLRVGNRWCIHPMEGWDGHADGTPSELTTRRWERFGASGAKLIWGGEAAAVAPEGRANPNQLLAMPETEAALARLRERLEAAHRAGTGDDLDLLVGLQLTHSGRYCRPNGPSLEPRIAWRHPVLDGRVGLTVEDSGALLSDDDVMRLIDRYVEAAKVAKRAGFRFVDVKCCHGYLLHEFLSARTRPGPFGGDLAGRSLALRTIIGRIRADVPGLAVGVRLSAFDLAPFEKSSGGTGRPSEVGPLPYRGGFGVRPDNPLEPDLTETTQLVRQLAAQGLMALNVSGGSPYYNPHVIRPAAFPPSDGYLPPEDPLVGVARHLGAVRDLKRAVPGLPMIASGLSYLQEWLPAVAQAAVRAGWCDAVGLGRMVLSYPELPRDVRAGRFPDRKRICRTFSDCTTGPRKGMISGCFPLDPFYRERPEAMTIRALRPQAEG